MIPDHFDAKAFLKTVPHKPGVYRMHDSKGDIIYVGKAKDLKQRVASYFRENIASSRTWSMVQRIAYVELTITETEVEALLLESNLIKRHKPRYNVLLRDDKSYPYIYVSSGVTYPRVCFHRGGKKATGQYFGPYPNGSAVRETLNLLQKLFRVRQCEDSYFSNRSRPCLQYQIKRCSAPCTQHITPSDYAVSVQHTMHFLQGKSESVIGELVTKMDSLAQALRFEEAAETRDQIEKLREISQQQYISGEKGNIDVIALQYASMTASIQVLSIRNGHNLGNQNYFPKIPDVEYDTNTIMEQFLAQYYLAREIPNEIIVNVEPTDSHALCEALSVQASHKVTLRSSVRSKRAQWLEMAGRNALHALNVQLVSRQGMQVRFQTLQEALSLCYIPARIECFDISHTQGEATIASCVVFGIEGAIKSDYRRYNITDIEAGDDYAAMRQVLERRFRRLIEGEGKYPDIILIDGGKGQVQQAYEVLQAENITAVDIVGIVKGEARKAEHDNLIIKGRRVVLEPHSPAMHLLQQIRDEAHRFAIAGHRKKRQKARTQSPLEDIAGLGVKRRQSLLKQFGGIRAIRRASVTELAKVNGISQLLAMKIYEHFNP